MKPRKAFFTLSALAMFVALVSPFHQTISKADAAAPTQEYSQWVESYQHILFATSKPAPLLIITSIEGDEPVESKNNFNSRKIHRGSQVFSDGRVSDFHIGGFGGGSGFGYQLSADQLEKLKQLLKKLPDDGGVLPPPNRRLLLRIGDGEKFQARVYNRANAPDIVWKIVSLGGANEGVANVGSFVPVFKPETKWTAYEHENGALAVSPDGNTMVSSFSDEPFKFWNPDTHELIKTIDTPYLHSVTEIVFSPDALQAALKIGSSFRIVDTAQWKDAIQLGEPISSDKYFTFSHPQWTRDGKFLLLQKTEREQNAKEAVTSLQIFDAQSGARVESLPQVPAGAFAFVPSPDGERAVIVSKTHAIVLWDVAARREIVVLESEDAQLNQVAFSPDRTLVAVVSIHKNSSGYYSKFLLRIWNAQTGALLHQLRPFEQRAADAISGVLWSPDSRYILAATESEALFTSHGISIWNVQSGRHRGQLLAPNSSELALLQNGHFIANSAGQIREWNLQNALAQIALFEESLTAK